MSFLLGIWGTSEEIKFLIREEKQKKNLTVGSDGLGLGIFTGAPAGKLSSVAQQQRISLPMQETRVQSLD